MTLTPPVQIGQTVYVASAGSHRPEQVPCPVCYGKLFAVLELGNGERVPVECDGCGIGYDGPRGFITVGRPDSSVTPVIVTGFEQDGEGWRIRGSGYTYEHWGVNVFATFLEADARRMVLYLAAVTEAEFRDIRQSEYLRKKPTWLVRYHREHIREAERALAWHTRKLSDALARQRAPVPA